MNKSPIDQKLDIKRILEAADLPHYDLRMKRKGGYYSYIWRAHFSCAKGYLNPNQMLEMSERAARARIVKKFKRVRNAYITRDYNFIIQVNH